MDDRETNYVAPPISVGDQVLVRARPGDVGMEGRVLEVKRLSISARVTDSEGRVGTMMNVWHKGYYRCEASPESFADVDFGIWEEAEITRRNREQQEQVDRNVLAIRDLIDGQQKLAKVVQGLVERLTSLPKTKGPRR